MRQTAALSLDRRVLDALDLRAEYQRLGIRFPTTRPTSNGWLSCHAVGRDDRSASAAVNLNTGRYKDHGGDGDNLSFFDFAAIHGGHGDWKAAREHYARQVGLHQPH